MSVGLMAEGRIGVVDAALVRCLQSLKECTPCLGVRVTESIYAPLIYIEHIKLFISALTVTDWVAPTGAEDRLLFPQGCTAEGNHRLVILPERDLQEYSVMRMLKQVDVRTEPCPEATEKLGHCEELAQRYGTDPARRELCVGVVSGSFDVIHPGHVCLMQQAKSMVDVLIVATQSTHSITQQPKNVDGDLPIYSEADRVEVLRALACVDHVVTFNELDCCQMLERLRPNYYIKHERDRGREIVQQEAALVDRIGGHTLYITHQKFGYTSGAIIQRIRQRS